MADIYSQLLVQTLLNDFSNRGGTLRGRNRRDLARLCDNYWHIGSAGGFADVGMPLTTPAPDVPARSKSRVASMSGVGISDRRQPTGALQPREVEHASDDGGHREQLPAQVAHALHAPGDVVAHTLRQRPG